MSYTVFLTDAAEKDLEEIYDYISLHDEHKKGEYVLEKMEISFNSLSQFPERGSFPKELLFLGIREYREIYFKPYRIIYRIIAKAVYIYLIADGRRDMQTLLQSRLLGA